MEQMQDFAVAFSALAWGPWLLVLLLGGGAFFLAYSRLLPFRFLGHAWSLLRGRHDHPHDPGQISHFQALSSALAGTIGMGNIAGVAVAISIGGPGAIFWMWVTAVLGIATKFFTCTLAVMFRGVDTRGEIQGGPMYVIREALPPRVRFLAYWFAIVGLVGCLPAFQTNQLVQIMRDVVFIPQGWIAADGDYLRFNLASGIVVASIVALVVYGGLFRIANVASKVVPAMTLLYIVAALVIVVLNIEQVPSLLWLIVRDAFTGEAAAGGVIAAVVSTGVQRGAFSNEAGIGTEALAHGAAKTTEPVREGLVAMVGPIIDTLIVCTATALVILTSGAWQSTEANGVTLTALSFGELLGPVGQLVLIVCVVAFALTTMLSYAYYGTKCFGFLFGAERQHYYNHVYVGLIVVAAVVSLETAIGIIDGSFALMAIPTMVSSLWLAPKVMAAARRYLGTLR
ncbi:MAG: alanine/glycine:cation symporter family protein [Gammaproteobacteria bacterium]|nr:alanine/glycine:cation symporter family protein [Gammaproteobacteria bacterium]